MSEHILEIPDAFNRFTVVQGIHPQGRVEMSEYVTFVKAKKIIRALTEPEIEELNKIVFREKLNKFNKWTRDKLISKLDLMAHVKLMRFIYVREKEGVLDAILCLINKKKFPFDQKFLTNFFKYGTKLNPL